MTLLDESGRPADHVLSAAEFAAHTELDQIPEKVRDHARLVLLDTVGAIVNGGRHHEISALAELTPRMQGPATASVPGARGGFAPASAAFINGTAGTWDELDEGNYPTNQHPAIHVVPAALAVAEALDISGSDLLAAIIIGYEIAARTGMATTFRDDVMHPHGTHGIIGGAAAVSRLRGFDVDRIAQTINVASSLSVATSRPTVFQGATVRNTYAGRANEGAVHSGDLVTAGFTGESDGVGSVFGAVSGRAFDAATFVDGLGSVFHITGNYFKLHACCAYNHATLDALQCIMAMRKFEPSDVESVDVSTYFPATRMQRVDVSNGLSAKFSIPYVVSAMLVLGNCGRDSFEKPALDSPVIRSLTNRVRVAEDPEATRLYPDEQRSSVRVLLRDGSHFDAAVKHVRGDAALPVPDDVIVEKFLAGARPVLGDSSEVLVDLLRRIDDVPVRAISSILRGKRG